MEYIIVLILLIIMLGVLYFVFNIRIKEIKKAGKNEKLDKLTSKFPENEVICESILKMINNKKVKIKENEDKNNKTSLYIVISDTIFIANIKDSYTRIQTIAHECIHSIQSKRMLLFNFIYSNIYFVYFVLSIILTIIGIFKNYNLQIIIISLMSFIYYTVRSYLETDAMIKAKYLAKEYMDNYNNVNPICTNEDIKEVISEYDRINRIGIPAYNYVLFTKSISKIIVYTIIVIILNFII